ncbi:hypothetical protein K439DRAFT_369291 [Ramaria rubella]|nr:hypothetical protein K439DRAFT_369291 [Ramaria rubella]
MTKERSSSTAQDTHLATPSLSESHVPLPASLGVVDRSEIQLAASFVKYIYFAPCQRMAQTLSISIAMEIIMKVRFNTRSVRRFCLTDSDLLVSVRLWCRHSNGKYNPILRL